MQRVTRGGANKERDKSAGGRPAGRPPLHTRTLRRSPTLFDSLGDLASEKATEVESPVFAHPQVALHGERDAHHTRKQTLVTQDQHPGLNGEGWNGKVEW